MSQIPAGGPAPDFAAALTNADDEMVKLVAYTIVTVRRDFERIMPGDLSRDQIVLTDRLTEDQVIAHIIGRYTSSPGFLDLPEEERNLELKYLRVYYVVSKRWPREPLRHEERELEVLGKIAARV